MVVGGIIAVMSAMLINCNVEAKPVEPVAIVEEAEPELVSLGEFRLTAYCSCSKCCGKWANNRPDDKVYGATGRELIAGYSIAVDPRVIAYGTEVEINGVTYRADDCGGAIKNNRIDVYFSNHTEALEFGVQYADVYVKEEE